MDVHYISLVYYYNIVIQYFYMYVLCSDHHSIVNYVSPHM